MSEESNNIKSSLIDNVDPLGCNFKEVREFAEYYRSLQNISWCSSEHLDLLDRTFRILSESKNNQIAIVKYCMDFAVLNGVKSIDACFDFFDSTLDEIESIRDSDNKYFTEREKSKQDIFFRMNEYWSEVNKEIFKELSSTRIKLHKHQDSKSKGGSYSPYKNNENEIIALLNQYRQSQSSLGNKQTHQELSEIIATKINKNVNLSTVKKWWANYKNSSGSTIFKKDKN
jgi:vacuolar-type H+-ATPase subunit I/STV1